MANNTRPAAYHSLNGDELRTIIENRVKQGVMQSMNLRAMYAFPLVRYKVTIEVIPYRPQGANEPAVDDKNVQRCIVEGQEFVEVLEEAIELTHDSPVIGWDKDPQDERREIGLGHIETKRVEGQFVDVHVGASVKVEEPQLPPARGRGLAQQTAGAPKKAKITQEEALGKDHKPVDVASGMKPSEVAVPTPDNPGGLPSQEVDRIAKQEAETWAQPAPDAALHNAIAHEEPLPGRVQVLKK